MAISKVIYKSSASATPETWMDATTATAAAADITSPKTAMLADGVMTTGTGTAPTGTKSISITANGTTTEDVTNYASAEISVNVSGGGGNDKALIEGTLEAYSNSEVTVLKRAIFRDVLSLKSVSFPNVTTTKEEVLYGCIDLKSFDLPRASSVGANFANACRRLTRAYLPSASGNLNNNLFYQCAMLCTCDLGPSVTKLAQEILRYTYALSELVFRGTSGVVPMTATHNLGEEHMSLVYQKTGYVYVPTALLSAYQQASNWSTFYGLNPNLFRKLEDYTVDGTTTGALDFSKIWSAHTPDYSATNLEFDGTNYVDTNVQLFDGNPFTIVFDISCVGGAPSNQRILSCHDANNVGMSLQNNGNAASSHYVLFNPSGSSQSGELLNHNNATHFKGFIRATGLYCLAETFDADGNIGSSQNFRALVRTGTAQTLTETLILGGDYVSGAKTPQFRGTINSIKVFKAALNTNEIISLLELEESQ